MRGELLTPEDSGCDGARTLWNATINRNSALIARCAGVSDGIDAVIYARGYDLQVSEVSLSADCLGAIISSPGQISTF